MKHISITNKDIVKAMTEQQKHDFTNRCIANNTEPEEVILLIKNVANSTLNFAIDLCNNYFKTPAGQEYLNMRKKIDKIGSD